MDDPEQGAGEDPSMKWWEVPDRRAEEPQSTAGGPSPSEGPAAAPPHAMWPPPSEGPAMPSSHATLPPPAEAPVGPSAGPGWLPPGSGPGEPVAQTMWPIPEVPPQHSGRRRLAALLLAAIVFSGGLGAALGALLGGGKGVGSASPGLVGQVPNATAGSANVERVTAAVDPAVVDINTTLTSDLGGGAAAGTGMILTSSGEVLTNNHVIDQAVSIRVTIAGRAGTYAARVIAANPTADVALLQSEGVSGLPTVHFANSAAASVGQAVVAIGNALGEGGTPTVTTGTVSALNRSITASDDNGQNPETLHGLISTDAQIQPGDSGGPLVNSSGSVLGMDTAAATDGTGATTGFALPSNAILKVVSQMRNHVTTSAIIYGKPAFLGIQTDQSTSSSSSGSSPYGGFPFGPTGTSGTSGSASVSGVPIVAVVPGTPAATAGLQAGDVIVGFNGTATPNASTLTNLIHRLHPGSQANVKVSTSAGTTVTFHVRLIAGPYV